MKFLRRCVDLCLITSLKWRRSMFAKDKDNFNAKTQTDAKLVHIGLPKTATTTLQYHLFKKHPDIHAFIQPEWQKNATTKFVHRALLENGCATTESLSEVLGAAVTAKPLVISDEALSFGEFMSRKTFYPGIITDHRATAQRIYQLLGQVHVVVVIRNQADFLKSFQKQLKRGTPDRAVPIKEFIEGRQKASNGRFLAALDYEELYDAYVSTIGHEYVHVFVYERWKNSFPELAQKLARIVNVNATFAYWMVYGRRSNVTQDKKGQRRFRARIFRKSRDDVHGPMNNDRQVSSQEAETIENRFVSRTTDAEETANESLDDIRSWFAERNKAFFSRVGLDGSGLGYW